MIKSDYHPDWWCTTCNFKIFGSKSRCKKCGTYRDDQSVPLPEYKFEQPQLKQSHLLWLNKVNRKDKIRSQNDWVCPGCKCILYGYRRECRKCKITKDEAMIYNVNACRQQSKTKTDLRPFGSGTSRYNVEKKIYKS